MGIFNNNFFKAAGRFGKGFSSAAKEGGKLFRPMTAGALIGGVGGGGVGYLQYRHAKSEGDEEANAMTSITAGALGGALIGTAAGTLGTAARGAVKGYRGMKGGFSSLKSNQAFQKQGFGRNWRTPGATLEGGWTNPTLAGEYLAGRQAAYKAPHLKALNDKIKLGREAFAGPPAPTIMGPPTPPLVGPPVPEGFKSPYRGTWASEGKQSVEDFITRGPRLAPTPVATKTEAQRVAEINKAPGSPYIRNDAYYENLFPPPPKPGISPRAYMSKVRSKRGR